MDAVSSLQLKNTPVEPIILFSQKSASGDLQKQLLLVHTTWGICTRRAGKLCRARSTRFQKCCKLPGRIRQSSRAEVGDRYPDTRRDAHAKFDLESLADASIAEFIRHDL